MIFQQFSSVLVANRGEIARRVIAAAHRNGMEAVAVYSDADAGAPFVIEADCAVRLPGNTPHETYLNIDKIIAAAQAAGADAVHPGYGFLSENEDFARAVISAGLVWIGPPPEAIAAMGSKIAAKQLMQDAGVPLLPDLTVDTVKAEHLPVIVKASAGGGGRGMRVVRDLKDLPGEVSAAQREAQSAFGNDTVFIERYIESGRHIEVQVLADRHGTIWTCGERECSIQRRHQKVIEEAPSVLVESHPGMREKLFEAARKAAAAMDYVGAGTVEFLANDAGEFFFLEVNTRLQVEHPVTEATTGLDLVSLQFAVAAGDKLPDHEIGAPQGWAIEARLYAEDPRHDYQPQSGAMYQLDFDYVVDEFHGPHRAGIRLDSGLRPTPGSPSHIGVHYDAMLAKIISWAPTRAEATGLLRRALTTARIHGVITNRDLLARILGDPDFVSGQFSTSFLAGERLAELSAPLVEADTRRAALVAAAAVADAADRASTPAGTGAGAGTRLPQVRPGFRNVGQARARRSFLCDGAEQECELIYARSGITSDDFRVAGMRKISEEIYEVSLSHAVEVTATVDTTVRVTRYGQEVFAVDTPRGSLTLTLKPRYIDPAAQAATGCLLAPMPGTVIEVAATVGEKVEAGDVLVRMEAMKMEHAITADVTGTLTDLAVSQGQHIESGTVLATIEPDEGAD